MKNLFYEKLINKIIISEISYLLCINMSHIKYSNCKCKHNESFEKQMISLYETMKLENALAQKEKKKSFLQLRSEYNKIVDIRYKAHIMNKEKIKYKETGYQIIDKDIDADLSKVDRKIKKENIRIQRIEQEKINGKGKDKEKEKMIKLII